MRGMVHVVVALLVGTGALAGPAQAQGAFGDFIVDPAGGDDANSGTSWEQAFRTVGRALEAGRAQYQTTGEPALVGLSNAAEFELATALDVEGVTLTNAYYPNFYYEYRPRILLTEPGARLRLLQDGALHFLDIVAGQPGGDEVCVEMAVGDWGSATMLGCVVSTTPAPGRVVTGVYIEDSAPSLAFISGNTFTGLATAIHTVNAAPLVTRNLFEALTGPAIRVDGAVTRQQASAVPRIGVAEDLERTGLNQFRTGGTVVDNRTPVSVPARLNDWGVYTAGEVAAKNSGLVDTSRFLGAGIGPGSAVIDVVDTSGMPLPHAASPACSLDGVAGQRDPASQAFVFHGVQAGLRTASASAAGYAPATRQVSCESHAVAAATVQLTKTSNGGPAPAPACGKQGAVAYAACLGLLWRVRVRRRRRGEALLHRRVSQ